VRGARSAGVVSVSVLAVRFGIVGFPLARVSWTAAVRAHSGFAHRGRTPAR
jgi:hypothetical protein